MAQIIIAPEYHKPRGPVIFLAGPITAATRWQDEAIDYLSSRTDAAIASPRRPHGGDGAFDEFADSDFIEQVKWEHHYLERAAVNGVTLFWLANPAKILSGHAYAQTTRFELGEAAARHYLRQINLAVGMEPDFPGGKYIQHTLSQKAPTITLATSLIETCDTALRLLAG